MEPGDIMMQDTASTQRTLLRERPSFGDDVEQNQKLLSTREMPDLRSARGPAPASKRQDVRKMTTWYDNDSSSDEGESYRKMKRRYKRKSFLAKLRCCASKDDAVDGLNGPETIEDELAEIPYEKFPLAERRQRYRRIEEGDQATTRKPKILFYRVTNCCSDAFPSLNALHFLRKLLHARGGGGVMAVFDLLQRLLTLNFVIGMLFFGAVYLPDLIVGPKTTFAPCNVTTVPENSTTYSELQEFIVNCSSMNLTFMEVVKNSVRGGCPVAESKLFLGSYDVDPNRYPTDKVYFICLVISYSLSICVVVKAFIGWMHLRHRFKFADSRNTRTTLLFKGWNFSTDTKFGKIAEQISLSQEIHFITVAEPTEGIFNPGLAKKRMLIHVVSALFTLLGLTAVMSAMYYLGDQFYISAIVTILGKLAEWLFNWLGKREQRQNHDELFWLVLRVLSFQLMSVGVMVYSELVLSMKFSTFPCTCWETHYAGQIYSMVLIIGADEIFHMTILPLLRLVFVKTCQCFIWVITCGKHGKIKKLVSILEPEYRTDVHLYKVIKLQTLGWLAIPVSPMMPLLVWGVLLLCLLVNMFIILGLKLRPKRWFGQARSSSFYATALLLSWVMCIWPITKVMFHRKPSSSCSPFRNLDQQYRALFNADTDFILMLVLMLGCVEAALMMLFFILRPRTVPDGKPKSNKTQQGYLEDVDGSQRSTESESSPMQTYEYVSETHEHLSAFQ